MFRNCFTPVEVERIGNVVVQKPIPKQKIEKKPQKTKEDPSSEMTINYPTFDDKKFPKVRVSIEAFEELQQFRKAHKCKSYCEVVSKLIEIYDANDSKSVQSKKL
ncbi:Uncharacterized protein QTN25_008890 [Entamoeba marina]